AGHSLVIDQQVYKLSLLPSCIVRPGKMAIIGNGVVLDPWALFKEIDTLTERGINISPKNLAIADNACLILPLHAELDRHREELQGGNKIGTTGRGIGPAYEDKVGRRAIRAGDLLQSDFLKQRINNLLSHHNALRQGLNMPLIEENVLFNQI
ncbi:MAG TPA: adenylosuccinate synthetase, partial [Alphaproteobacteria bacterium]|nr:adenylosuccinate synthetase [Alphaproteobacteria bacterium]